MSRVKLRCDRRGTLRAHDSSVRRSSALFYRKQQIDRVVASTTWVFHVSRKTVGEVRPVNAVPGAFKACCLSQDRRDANFSKSRAIAACNGDRKYRFAYAYAIGCLRLTQNDFNGWKKRLSSTEDSVKRRGRWWFYLRRSCRDRRVSPPCHLSRSNNEKILDGSDFKWRFQTSYREDSRK